MSNKQASNEKKHNKPNDNGKKNYGPRKPTTYQQVGAVPELPTIDFQNRSVDVNHFNVVKYKLKDYIAAKYARNALFFDTNADYEYPEVEKPKTPYDDKSDPFHEKRTVLKKKFEQRAVLEAQYEENKPLVYAIIWGQCTPTLRLRLKRSLLFAEMDATKNPLLLWREITKVCLGNHRTNSNAIVVRYEARKRFDDLFQGSDKIGAFYERFLAHVDAAKSVGVEFASPVEDEEGNAVDDEEQKVLAIMFIKKLDKKRFGSLQNKLENDLSLGMDVYPITVVEAYEMAASWRDGNSSKFADDIVTTSNGNVPQIPGIGLHTNGGKGKKNSDKSSNHGENNKKSGKSSEQRACYVCGLSDHMQRDCPTLALAKEMMKDKKEEEDASKGNTTRSTMLTFSACTLCFEKCEEVKECCEEKTVLACGKVDEDQQSSIVFDKRDILLDNQSNTHIFNNKHLLTNLRRVKEVMSIKGVNGGALETNVVGDFMDVQGVYYHPRAVANILCYHDMVHHPNYTVDYDKKPKDQFLVTSKITSHVMIFKSWKKLYKYRHHQPRSEQFTAATIETLEDNKAKFTKDELARAEKAKELLIALGRPSVETLIQALKSGTIMECPVTVKDVQNMVKIYRHDMGSVKGKTVRRPAEVVRTEEEVSDEGKLRSEDPPESLVLCADLMYINGLIFLLSTSRRYNLLMVKYLDDKAANSLLKGLQEMVAKYKSYNCSVKTILFDGEGALGKITPELNAMGIVVNPAGKGAHVPEIERSIRVVKERVRSYVSVMPFNPTSTIIAYLVYFCVATINIFPRKGTINDRRSAKEILSGVKPNYRHFTKVLFGEYVQVYDEDSPTNSMKSRTTGAIALGLCESRQGMHYFLSLTSWRVIVRRSFIKMPMPKEIIQLINAKADTDKSAQLPLVFTYGAQMTEVAEDLDEYNELDGAQQLEAEENEEDQPLNDADKHNATGFDNDTAVEVDANLYDDDGSNPQVEGLEDIIDPAADDQEHAPAPAVEEIVAPAASEEIPSSEDEEEPPEEQPVEGRRYSLRPNREKLSWKSFGKKRDGATFTNLSVKKAIKTHGSNAVVSLMKELEQMVLKKVFKPVKKKDVKKKPLPIIMFLKLKRDGRLKARGVADGRWQRLLREMSSQSTDSSPTISTEALMITLIVDAAERRIVITIDIDGAYLHADMDEEVYIMFDHICTSILLDLYPDLFEAFVNEEGRLYGRLEKALYGCLQSARLFYEHLRRTLENIGFTVNPYDVCVFIGVYAEDDGKISPITITVHVDDLKVSSQSSKALEWVAEELRKVYKKINVNEGKVIDYLGMILDFSCEGEIRISSRLLVEDAIEQYELSPTCVAKTPAANYLFMKSEKADKLDGDERDKFHSVTQKLLYIAKHARPDILLAVSYLTTRVSCPTTEDRIKLIRVLKYLNGTLDLSLRISGDENGLGQIYSFVDASFATHPDAKSHTGGIIGIGGNLVMAKSVKQKINVKSSTEAELVGVSDVLPYIMWMINFVGAQGYKMGDKAVLYQDNMSTMRLMNNGKPCSNRTRHLHIRYFFVTDQIRQGKLEVKYIQTEEMVADYFTKPLQGEQFFKLRRKIMNEFESCSQESTDLSKGCVGGNDHEKAKIRNSEIQRVDRDG